MSLPAPVAVARGTGVAALLAIGALHVAWAAGSSWPASDRISLARAVIGRDRLPGPAACAVVASLLGVAAAFVAGWPRDGGRLQRFGAGGVAAVLVARGAAGFSGSMPQARASANFARNDRRWYSPLCLGLGVLASAGAYRSRKRDG